MAENIEDVKEINEALQNDLNNSLSTIENLKRNQEGLINQNNLYQAQIKELRSEKPMIYSKMIAIKRDLKAVGKDQKNSGQGWKFRGIDQFMNALKPILDNHDVGITTKYIGGLEPKFEENGHGKKFKHLSIIMEYTFFAEDGSSVTSSIPAEGVGNDDKGTNKALSAAFKYALMQTFCVPTEDMEEADLHTIDINEPDGKTVVSAPKKAIEVEKLTVKEEKPKRSFRRRSGGDGL